MSFRRETKTTSETKKKLDCCYTELYWSSVDIGVVKMTAGLSYSTFL